MSRINTNVESLIAQRVLGQNNFQLGTTLQRLSTGLRINRGKDDPAGLIASENLRSEKASINAAITNAERADQVVNIAEGGLQEVSNLLTELQGLVTETANTAGLSDSEKDANQLQIDSILQTIDRIADSTSFQGTKLLNGNFDFATSGVSASVADFKIDGAKVGNGDTLDVNIVRTQSAQTAGKYLNTSGALDLGGGTSSFTIEVGGSLGARELSFASATAVSDISDAINTFTDVTGVRASSDTNGVYLISSEFGSDEFVSVKVIDDAGITGTSAGIYDLSGTSIVPAGSVAFTAAAAQNGVTDFGQDLGATINGIAATADGKTISINTDFLNVEVTLDTTASQALGSYTAFTIAGGGADFQLAPVVDIAGKVSIGLQDVAARKLGESGVGFLDDLASGKGFNVVDGDLTEAQKVVDAAIDQLSGTRGRIGAFQKNTVGATIRSLGIALENTAAAESIIRDADFATESAELTRSQILANASTQILTLANSQPQSALQLLG